VRVYGLVGCWLGIIYAKKELEGLPTVTVLLTWLSGLSTPSRDRMNIDGSAVLMEYNSRSTSAGSFLG
jgi:hypothetical protein